MRFERMTTTVGTNGTISMPLFDSSGGIPLLRIGPVYERHSIRYFVKMPDLEDAGHLPAPMNADRNTITFEPCFVYISSPIPPGCNAKFLRAVSGNTKGKITKKPIRKWTSNESSTIYPVGSIQIPQMRPGDTIELEGVSFFQSAKKTSYAQRKKQRLNPFAWSSQFSIPPPQSEMTHPLSIQLLVKLHYLPKTGSKKRYKVVEGSPLAWNEAPMPVEDKPKEEFFEK